MSLQNRVAYMKKYDYKKGSYFIKIFAKFSFSNNLKVVSKSMLTNKTTLSVVNKSVLTNKTILK